MKASDFIIHLQQMIEEHGDLPLAVLEANEEDYGIHFIEVDCVDSVIQLNKADRFFDKNDELQDVKKVFLIDWG